MKTKSARVMLLVALAAAVVGACEGNGTTVGQKLDRALDTTQQKLAAAGDKIAQQTDKVVTKAKEETAAAGTATTTTTTTTRTEARPLSDTAITASIKTDYLKDPDLSVLKIDVDTKSGVVTLNGLAENDDARKRAEKIAESVKGVREVRNFLVIKRA